MCLCVCVCVCLTCGVEMLAPGGEEVVEPLFREIGGVAVGVANCCWEERGEASFCEDGDECCW